ncbi:MAG: 2,3-bisphosphoglycerate-independent phosphoglycerate mutase [Bacilli bacterium]|nr:2,3-bisphosphoglycerate-independent phosphoglycerate mutase [Bacilli bacterium]
MKKKPIILCIMDGYGIRKASIGNAVLEAKKPNLDKYFSTYSYTEINASGEYVGLPDGQMGNSEVGHMNMGAGRIVYQSLSLINKAIKEKTFFDNQYYIEAMNHAKKNNSKLHIFGLTSDGGVHSHINHILAIIEMAKKQGLKDVYMHCFMDGRDVDPQAGYKYVKMIQDKMDELNFGHIADIGGRYWGMDRDKNMDRVDVAYRLMVDHDGPSFNDMEKFFKDQYEELPKLGKDASDEFIIPHFNENVDGRISDNDAIIFMNYRPDRAIQISTLFTNPNFYENPPKKEDGTLAYKPYVPKHPLKNIFYVCTMKYADSVKGKIAFELPKLTNILGVYLADHGYSQLRIAETEKYAHVTFFFDGTMNFDGVERPELKNCTRVLINSPKVATYDLQPEMSAYKVLDALLKELNKDYLDVVILNFANCDMVGHTAVHNAVVKAVETVDECVGKIIEWCNENDATLIVTADHGNAEEILDANGKPFTAHTTNLVPFCINKKGFKLKPTEGKLADIAPTIIDLLGDKKPEDMSGESLIIK